jgi:hypothetical protein
VEETLYQVMAGARAALEADGVTLVGGHTSTGPELVVGFAVWGFVASADALIRIGGAAPGDQLLLTKRLGTGVILQADMRALARGEWVEAATASMLRSNGAAARAIVALGPSAATDVTGFGLARHLGEMLRASKSSAVLDLAAIPALPGAVALLGRGIRSTAHPENARARRAMLVEPDAARRESLDLLFDPQTSGGLLVAVPPARGSAMLSALHAAGDGAAAIIGEVAPPRPDGALIRAWRRAGDEVGRARRGDLDDEAGAPAVWPPIAPGGDQIAPGPCIHHTGPSSERAPADPRAHRGRREQIPHPVCLQAVLGDQVVAAVMAGEPDLDLPREPAAPADRGQVEILRLGAHAPKARSNCRRAASSRPLRNFW